jgi:hypothetical protein
MKEPEELAGEATTYTKAEDWPTDDGAQDLVLPSGANVRVMAPPVMWMAMTGKIPAFIVAMGKHHQATEEEWTLQENEKILDWLVSESFIEPKVSLTKKAGFLHIARLSNRDKEAVAMTLRLRTYAEAVR